MNKEKICLELKKERKKIQHQHENFDQYCCDNFWSQDQNKECNFHWSFQQDFQQFFKWDHSRLKNYLFIKKCDYCKKNHFYFKYSYSNYSIKICKFSFNLNQVFIKNDKIKLQFFKTWSKKCTKVQILHASSSSNNDKTDYNIYIIIDDSESDSDRLCKCLKN